MELFFHPVHPEKKKIQNQKKNQYKNKKSIFIKYNSHLCYFYFF